MIDPITYSELLSGDVLGNIYESFARLDAEGNVVPSLATSWVAHEDNRGFRFHLRADVSFHSGRTLTAADVKWSLEQLLIPGNRGGLNAKYAASIEGAGAVQSGDTEELSGITAVDELTLDVRFREAEVLFRSIPSTSWIVVSSTSTAKTGGGKCPRGRARSRSWNGAGARSCG